MPLAQPDTLLCGTTGHRHTTVASAEACDASRRADTTASRNRAGLHTFWCHTRTHQRHQDRQAADACDGRLCGQTGHHHRDYAQAQACALARDVADDAAGSPERAARDGRFQRGHDTLADRQTVQANRRRLPNTVPQSNTVDGVRMHYCLHGGHDHRSIHEAQACDRTFGSNRVRYDHSGLPLPGDHGETYESQAYEQRRRTEADPYALVGTPPRWWCLQGGHDHETTFDAQACDRDTRGNRNGLPRPGDYGETLEEFNTRVAHRRRLPQELQCGSLLNGNPMYHCLAGDHEHTTGALAAACDRKTEREERDRAVHLDDDDNLDDAEARATRAQQRATRLRATQDRERDELHARQHAEREELERQLREDPAYMGTTDSGGKVFVYKRDDGPPWQPTVTTVEHTRDYPTIDEVRAADIATRGHASAEFLDALLPSRGRGNGKTQPPPEPEPEPEPERDGIGLMQLGKLPGTMPADQLEQSARTALGLNQERRRRGVAFVVEHADGTTTTYRMRGERNRR